MGVVSSHLKNSPPELVERELEAVLDAGFGWIRCDFAWYDLEPRSGTWNLGGTDHLVDQAGKRCIRILGILGSSPPWANGGRAWNYPPTDLQAWRNYVRTVVSHYRGKVAAWEVWNEQNIHAFWQPEPDPVSYVRLLAAASEEIRKSDPGAQVVMGGVAGLDPDYLNACLSLGASEYVDALAYHPYAETIGEEGQSEADRLRPKEKLCRDIVAFVRDLIGRYTQKRLEIWVTEVGWTTWEGELGVEECTQADYLARTVLNYGDSDVSKVFVYNLRDTLLNEVDRYGLLRVDFSHRESFRMMRTLLREASDAVPASLSPFVLRCSKPDTLESHAFLVRGEDIFLFLWKRDDAPDTLSLRMQGASSFRLPLVIDLISGETESPPGMAREPSGDITVGELCLGKSPVALRFTRVGLLSLNPSRGYQFTPVLSLERVEGRGFEPGASLELVRGNVRLACYDARVVSESEARCRVGLWGAEPGRYDLVLINPDGSRAVLPSAFEVLPVCGWGGGAIFFLGVPLLIAVGLTPRLKNAFLGDRLGRGWFGDHQKGESVDGREV